MKVAATDAKHEWIYSENEAVIYPIAQSKLKETEELARMVGLDAALEAMTAFSPLIRGR